jgi:hypothetical protein
MLSMWYVCLPQGISSQVAVATRVIAVLSQPVYPVARQAVTYTNTADVVYTVEQAAYSAIRSV